VSHGCADTINGQGAVGLTGARMGAWVWRRNGSANVDPDRLAAGTIRIEQRGEVVNHPDKEIMGERLQTRTDLTCLMKGLIVGSVYSPASPINPRCQEGSGCRQLDVIMPYYTPQVEKVRAGSKTVESRPGELS